MLSDASTFNIEKLIQISTHTSPSFFVSMQRFPYWHVGRSFFSQYIDRMLALFPEYSFIEVTVGEAPGGVGAEEKVN